MTGELVTPEQLAERFQISLEKFHDLRKRNHWPCVRLGRFEYRFTEDQVEEIVERHTLRFAEEDEVARLMRSGLTRRSAQHHARTQSR